MIIHALTSLPERELAPGFHAKLVHSEEMSFAYWRIEDGAALEAHAHPHEQVVHVLEGTFELTVGNDTSRLSPGSVVVIPGDVSHSGHALSACRILDVWAPVRQDLRDLVVE